MPGLPVHYYLLEWAQTQVHWLRHEFEEALGIDNEQGSLACFSPWGCRVRHNWVTELYWPELVAQTVKNLPATQETRNIPLRKEYVKAVYCRPAYLTSMQSTSWEILGWMNHKLESRLPGETATTTDIQMILPNGRKWGGTKQPLDKGKRGEWKSWFKTHYSKMKIMSPAQVGCMRQLLGPGALGRPRGIGRRGRWEGGPGWGTH